MMMRTNLHHANPTQKSQSKDLKITLKYDEQVCKFYEIVWLKIRVERSFILSLHLSNLLANLNTKHSNMSKFQTTKKEGVVKQD